MSEHNKSSSNKVNIYSSINDLIVFKIANIELNYSYKSNHSKNYQTKTRIDNQYETKIKNFLQREIINYACRLAPAMSDSFWESDFDENTDGPIEKSKKMDFRFESNFKNSKLKVFDPRINKPTTTAIKNLRKIEFFSTKTMLEAVTIQRARDFDIIHSYLVETQKRVRNILDKIIDCAIIDWNKEFKICQLSLQKNLIIHLFHLDRINLKKPDLSLRIRKCSTKEKFPKKSDCKTPYFYASKLEENKYCSKACKIDFPLFENATDKAKRVKRKTPIQAGA